MLSQEGTRMLNDIRIVDFVLVDLSLYLDTHPFDQEAIEYFNHYTRIKNKMNRDFSMRYFPLTKDLAESNKEWRWGAAPLPWEGEC
ncbi:MAG: spore coat protein CotJB [bacterium]|nr:spore coat protein CotJB [bacterium]